MKDKFAVILVPSTGHAVRAEKVLIKAGITCKLIPVPRQFSSDCGVCVRILKNDFELAKSILNRAKVCIEGQHYF